MGELADKLPSVPALPPRQRRKVLENVVLLEELDNLHRNILDILGRTFREQKRVAAEILRWTSGSLYPMNPEELRVALAIEPGKPTCESNMIAGFPHCLPRITCSLVEADSNGAVNFIHLSLKEFLSSNDTCVHPEFALHDASVINNTIAARCLSCLVIDVPSETLRPMRLDLL